jgi:hypothetical protein
VSAAVTSPRERTHQKEHAVAPAFEKRFDPQTWQTALEAAARTSEKEPALQSVHNDSEAAACWLPYLPTGQSKHRSVREPRPHPCVSTKYRCDKNKRSTDDRTDRGILRHRHFHISLPDKAYRQWMLASSICIRVRACIFGWQNIDIHGINALHLQTASKFRWHR